MVAKSKSALVGMNDICAYVSYSAPTVLKWIREEGFPAVQSRRGGIWESNVELVDDWRRERIRKKAGK